MVEQVTVNHLVDGSNPPRGAKLIMQSIYHIEFQLSNNSKLKLSSFKGKPFLVTNTASKCGFSNQYKALEKLHTENNIDIIGTPSSDFGNQEFNTNDEIQCFLDDHYPVSFYITEKINIKESPHPFYLWLKENGSFMAQPRWNFYKYLFNSRGELVKWYSSLQIPSAKKINQLR